MVFGKEPAVSYTALDPHEQPVSEGRQNSTITKVKHGWRPVWMRRSVLILFLICFAALLAALQVLDILSVRHDGLASTDMSYHYLWTYGPTAILTLYLALWNRVDYRVRQMAPWTVLHDQLPVPASRSIFLDYISPTVPEILWNSLMNGDFAVTASTLVVMLVTILIVVSTSLLSLVPRPVTLTGIPYQTTLRFVNNETNNLTDQSMLPGNIIDAIDTLNLSYPLGATSQHAYQPFELAATNLSSNLVQQAQVEVMSFDLDCEEAQLDYGFWSYSWMWSPCHMNTSISDGPSLNASMNATTSNCTIGVPSYYEYGSDGDVGNFAVFQYDQCDEGSAFDNRDVRMFFMFGQARQNGEVGPPPVESGCPDEAPTADIEILRSKQWTCRPSLSSLPGNITFNSTSLLKGGVPQISLDETAERRNFDNISFWDLTSQVIWISLAEFSEQPTLQIKGMPDMQGAEMRVLRSMGPENVEDLATTDLYLELSTAFYKQALSILTHLQLTEKDNTTITGTASLIHNRLVVRDIPLRAMQGLLGGTIILVLYLIIALPGHSVTPRDPTQLGGLSDILAQNPQLASSFARTGSIDLHTLQQAYALKHYRSLFIADTPSTDSAEGRFWFMFEQTSSPTHAQGPRASNQLKWWRPMTVSIFSRITAFSIVVVSIVVLQVLLTFSNRNQGLAAAFPSGTENLAWSIVPAVIMATIATYFRALGTVYKTFAPYCLLRKGSNGARTLSRNYLSMTEVEVLFHALFDRQIGVSSITFATMLAAFLTIAVSGVFTVLPIPLTFNTTLSQKSWFIDTGSDDNGTVGNSGPISGLILMSNLSYPQWTYENLALASFVAGEDPDRVTSNGTDARFRGTVPAIRIALNCTLYEQKDIGGLEYIAALGGPGNKGIFANKLGKSEACTGNTSEARYLTGGGTTGGDFYWSGFLNNTNDGCPFLNYYWGYQGPTGEEWGTYNVTYIRGLACYETTEQLDVDATFIYPGLQIDTSAPPVSLENSSELFTTALTTLPYAAMPQPEASTIYGDAFWNAAIARFGLVDQDFGNPDLDEKIIEAIKYSQGVVRAQQYHVALRSEDGATANFSPARGIVTDTGRYRLVMNRVSTDVLCGLLAGILIFAGLSGWLMSTKHVLPKNPSSLGAMISLLADSNFFGQTALTSEQATRGKFALPILNASTFKMGWFTSKYGAEKVFTIHRVENEISHHQEKDDGSSSMSLRERSGPTNTMRKGFTALSP